MSPVWKKKARNKDTWEPQNLTSQLHFQSVTWHSGIWDAVVSEPFENSIQDVMSEVAASFQASKHEPKLSQQREELSPPEQGQGALAGHPLRREDGSIPAACPAPAVSSMRRLIEYPGLSALRLWGALYSLWEDKSQPAVGWRSAAGGRRGFQKLSGTGAAAGPPWSSPPPWSSLPFLPPRPPQDAGWSITEIGIWRPGKYVFSPCRKLFWSCCNENWRRGWVKSAVPNPAASSRPMPWGCCAGSAFEVFTCLWHHLLSGYLLSHERGVVLLFSCCMLLITPMLSRETSGKTNTVCQVNLPGDSCVTGLCACVSPLLQACFHLPDLGLSLLRTWHCYRYA